MAQVITTDGKMQRIVLNEDPEHRLQQLQEAVGGYIELVGKIEMGACVFANEMGRILNLPINEVASTMLDRLIVGDIVVLSATEMQVANAASETMH